eukprot:gnl/TRDRNA2_/TRDRNA2_203455_c0_seq1.p1 gnl/TRDRNA2_/TRDRNA2_203455_c0~~gnl/TRDRNA2_/TRDRNA2_203455_c0_seq1.p1  ORF type:complete len:252 (+),score=17.99 gnl/TRDRNA2_/TRDRNA2_203455_c0_seq1:110-865(+)
MNSLKAVDNCRSQCFVYGPGLLSLSLLVAIAFAMILSCTSWIAHLPKPTMALENMQPRQAHQLFTRVHSCVPAATRFHHGMLPSQTAHQASSSSRSMSGNTTLLHLDHMNDHKGYSKTLTRWASQLKLSGVIFLPVACTPRPRHVFVVLDADSPGQISDFLKRLRTQNVDVNSRGQPCKERMSSVVVELPRVVGLQAKGLQVIKCDGSDGPQTHLPFVREWLRRERPPDAEPLIRQLDDFLDATIKAWKQT